MANEDLIYQMTKTVLARLGPQADARLVEEIVADLYRLVDRAGDGGATLGGGAASLRSRVVVSAFGTSRPGIVAAIASTLAEAKYNIVDMNQTVVQGKFAMVLIAEAAEGANDLASLKEQLRAAGENVGVRILAQREDLFQAMHRV
jgi:ACT domain-containing protein